MLERKEAGGPAPGCQGRWHKEKAWKLTAWLRGGIRPHKTDAHAVPKGKASYVRISLKSSPFTHAARLPPGQDAPLNFGRIIGCRHRGALNLEALTHSKGQKT